MAITIKEQEALFDECGTPEHIRAHCNAVAEVAYRIGKFLNERGLHLDLETIVGAARVHDLARLQPSHDLVGATILHQHGYDKEAKLVINHTHYFPFHQLHSFDEQDVLCLADRTVRENAFVGIDERFRHLAMKPGVTPELKKEMDAVLAETHDFIEHIEQETGVSLEDLCGDVVAEPHDTYRRFE